MNPKERWLAAIHMQPTDRLLFWPKLNPAYPSAQAAPFSRMSLDQIHQWVGSDRHCWLTGCSKEVRPHTALECETKGDVRTTRYITPQGTLQRIDHFDRGSHAWHPMSFPVKSREDIEILTRWYDDATVEVDHDLLAQLRAQNAAYGDQVLTANGIGESPLMFFVEWAAGVAMAHYLLADHPAEVEALFAAMHRALLDHTRIILEHSPADVFYFIENTSTTLISPDQYRKYCFKHLTAYARVAQQLNRPIVLHMCGHLKALLPMLDQVPVHAFEAFTSPTVGNTSLAVGRSHCPDKCLIGGTNATLWTRSVHEIIAQLEHDLAELPHHRGIVPTSAGVMPPACSPETIKAVCDWVKHYPVRNSAA